MQGLRLLLRAHHIWPALAVVIALSLGTAILPTVAGTPQMLTGEPVMAATTQVYYCFAGMIAAAMQFSQFDYENRISSRPVAIHVLAAPSCVAIATCGASSVGHDGGALTGVIGFAGFWGVSLISGALVSEEYWWTLPIAWFGCTLTFGADPLGVPRIWAWTLMRDARAETAVFTVGIVVTGLTLQWLKFRQWRIWP